MHHIRISARMGFLAALIAASLAACSHGFQLKQYAGRNEDLFRAAVREYQQRNWGNAVTAFERLTLDLPARDTLLPRAFFYLGQAHAHQKEWLLAAQTMNRLAETFPTDTLADDALWETGKAYEHLWRKPVLDPANGTLAQTSFRSLIALYPDSPLAQPADREVAKLNEWLATKDYENGAHYLRRKAYDSAIIYFKDVIKNYPDAPRTKDAYLGLVKAYRAIRYTEDANEACTALRTTWPADREVRETCGTSPARAAPRATP